MAISTTAFADSFDVYDSKDWYTSDFTMHEGWIHNDWRRNNVTLANGEVTLELNTIDSRGKSFTGGELQTNDRFGYGHYQVTMKASGEEGVNSSFFTYTGPYFGHTWNEIDFEFLGKDPTKVSLAYHNGNTHWSKWIDLGFDASKGYHTYSFSWSDNRITWYADGKELYTATGDGIPDTPGKMYMNIWTGMNDWLGEPTFTGSTTAHYRDVSYSPTIPTMPKPATPGTVALYLVDSDSGDTVKLLDGATVTVSTADLDDLTIVAKVTSGSGPVESVRFDLDGAMDKGAIESITPYALFGDRNGALFGGMKTGSYSLKADAFALDGAAGALRATSDIDFTIRTGTPATAEIAVKVIDSATGTVLTTLDDGDVLDVAALRTSTFAFVATVTGDQRIVGAVDSLVFDLDGARDYRRVENIAPYAIFGDDDGRPYGERFAKGTYELEIDAYGENGGKGALLVSQDFDFLVV